MPPTRTKPSKQWERMVQPVVNTSVTTWFVGGISNSVVEPGSSAILGGEVVESLLAGLPHDILFEICASLHPLSVLYLSRTCKKLRNILMSIESRHAWRTSFEFILLEGIRDVRDDLCEPRLANLLFEDRCDVCQNPRGKGEYPQFELRANLCDICLHRSGKFLNGSFLTRMFKGVAGSSPDIYNRLCVIKSLTPSASSKGFSAEQVLDYDSFAEMFAEIKDMTATQFSQWCIDEKENFGCFQDQCKQLEDFKIRMNECAKIEKTEEKLAILNQRRKDILARCEEAGYVANHRKRGETDQQFWDDVRVALRRRKTTKHCWNWFARRAPLTDEEWDKGMLTCLTNCGKVVDRLSVTRSRSPSKPRSKVSSSPKRGTRSKPY